MDSNILNNFELPKDTSGNFKAKCRHCASLISGSQKVTSNFVTHMKRKHRDILLNVQQEKKSQEQPSMSAFIKGSKYNVSDPRQIQLTDALVMFIAGDLLPLSIVDSQNFRNFVEKADPRYQMPSRKHLSSKLLHEKSSEVKSNLKSLLTKAQSVCLTIDLWSNRQMRAFMGITGHFIIDWTMKSVMICCKRFKGKHTAENIRNEYEETIACFNIADKICSVISDNTSNMIKAFTFSLPGYKKDQSESTEDEDEDEIIIDEGEDGDESCFDEFDCLPKHSRCYAHTLQLVVKDGLSDCGPHLKNVIGKAASIVSYVRRSILASEILEDENRLQAANATRWNSQLYMIQSVLKVSEEKLNNIDCSVKLSSYERKLLQELCTILDPFENATLLVQKELNVSASLTIPVTLGLKHQINKISGVYNSKMVTTLKSSISSRLSPFEEDESYIMAAVLDPRFKLRWCESDKVDYITSLVRETLNKHDEVSSPCGENEEFSPPSKKVKSDLFSFMPPSTTPKRKRNASGTAAVDIYLAEPCTDMSENPLSYWKMNSSRFPLLSRLAVKYLAIPATSAPVERLFSVAGKMFRPDRCSLNDETFEKLMMIKCNKDIV